MAGIWLPNIHNFFSEMVDLITNAEQSSANCDSPESDNKADNSLYKRDSVQSLSNRPFR